MKKILLIVACVISVPALAQADPYQKLEARFAKADVDHDGRLTLAEAQAGMPRLARHFDEIDTAHAGYVTLPEIEQFAAAHKKPAQ
jgi:hypothetical protein